MIALLRSLALVMIFSLVGCTTTNTSALSSPEGAVGQNQAISRVALRLVPPYRMNLINNTLFDNQLLVDTVLGTLQDQGMVHPEGGRSVIIEVAEAGVGDDPLNDYILGGFVVVDEATGVPGALQPVEIRYQGSVDIPPSQRLALMFQALGQELAAQLGQG